MGFCGCFGGCGLLLVGVSVDMGCCCCFIGVSKVMVVVVVEVFGVSRWLIWRCWCVSLIVEDRDRDEVMEEIIIFNIICWYILYYFNELFI